MDRGNTLLFLSFLLNQFLAAFLAFGIEQFLFRFPLTSELQIPESLAIAFLFPFGLHVHDRGLNHQRLGIRLALEPLPTENDQRQQQPVQQHRQDHCC